MFSDALIFLSLKIIKAFQKHSLNSFFLFVSCICPVGSIILLINLYHPFTDLFSKLKHQIGELLLEHLRENWLKQKLDIVFSNKFYTGVFNWTWGDLKHILKLCYWDIVKCFCLTAVVYTWSYCTNPGSHQFGGFLS